MQDNKEVLTMEQLNSLIGKACECISVANNKTKVKLRKIIQNEAFECLNEEPSDLIKAIDILWSEQPEDAVVIKKISEWKLEGIKIIEDENLVIKIIDKENVCDETRSLFPGGSYDYIVEVSVKGFTTTFSKDFSMVECFEPLAYDEGHEGRADYTIGEALNGYGKKIYSLAEKFCLINMVGLEVTEKLLKVAKVNYQLTLIIIENCQKRLIEDSNYVEIVDSLKSLYEQEMNIKPREKGFKFYLEGIFEIYNLHSDDILMIHLAEYVVSEKQKNINFIQEAKDKQQTIIDITPHQTLSIEAAAATVEDDKKEMTFNDLFPSIEDKEMVMKMLVALKIINSEDKYLLGTKTGIIRVFIDVMKEEGYFNDIHRKPILRIFTPVILGRRIEVINEPANFNVIKNRILIKLKELRK